MFKKKIAWLLIIAMLLTQNGMTIFADNKGIANEETVESIEETAETSRGGASEESVGTNDGEETIEEIISSDEVEESSEEIVGSASVRPYDEPEEESEETTVGAKLGEPEEETEEETELTKSKTEDDLYGWSNLQTAQVKYMARTGGTIEGPEEGMYPYISLYDPSKWYVDGVEGEVWFPGGADAIDNGYYTDTYEFKTDTGDSNVSNAPYTVWGDYDKTYAFYSDLLRKYYVFKGWTSDYTYADPFNESYNKIEYYPGVQYTGIFKDNGNPKELYPVFIESNNLPGGGSGSYENDKVTIEFWQGYDDNQSEAELQQFVYGPTGYGISFIKVVNDQFPSGKDVKNNGPSDTSSNDDQLWF